VSDRASVHGCTLIMVRRLEEDAILESANGRVRAFVCYADADTATALVLHKALVAQGRRAWIDKLDIPPGAEWQSSIESAIENCGHLLVLLSAHSVNSREVTAEWNLARDLGKPIVPVLLDGTEVPFRLRGNQWVDLSKLGLDGSVEQLCKVLPRIAQPRHFEITAWEEAREHPECATVRISGHQRADRLILVSPGAYESLGRILDDLFSHYLHPTVSSFSYGSEWILIGDPFDTLLAVPQEWVSSTALPISALAAEWAEQTMPSDVNLRPGTHWEVARFQRTEGYTWRARIENAYVVVANDRRLVDVLLSDAKAISLIVHENVLVPCPSTQAHEKEFRFRFVFRDWLGLGLSGVTLSESGQPLSAQTEALLARRLSPGR